MLDVLNWVFVVLHAGRVFNGSGKPIDRGPAVMAEDFLDIMGTFPKFLNAAYIRCQSSDVFFIFFTLQVSPLTRSAAFTPRR